MTTVSLGKVAFTWKGSYDASTTYNSQDVVEYNGDSFVCITDNTSGTAPTSTSSTTSPTTNNLTVTVQQYYGSNYFYIDGVMRFTADSDSLITKGMIALFVRVLDGHAPDEILTADMSFIAETGLKEHLAPTRANALNLMATEMKKHALEASR